MKKQIRKPNLEKINDKDAVLFIHSMLSEGAVTDDSETREDLMIVTIKMDEFEVRLTTMVPNEALDFMRYGSAGWSIDVKVGGVRAMSGSLNNLDASEIARMINDANHSSDTQQKVDSWEAMQSFTKKVQG